MDLRRHFDQQNNRHTIEGQHFVLHCHHYNTLIHRAIVQTPLFDGKEFFFSTVGDEFYKALKEMALKQRVSGIGDIMSFCSRIYQELGMGKIDLSRLSSSGGTATASFSHLSQGYLSKWGRQAQPVDDFGRGFTAAAWALAFDGMIGDCKVKQTKCISMGDSSCEFVLTVGKG